MPTDQVLAGLIRHTNWLINLVTTTGGCRVLVSEVSTSAGGRPDFIQFTYLDPNGDRVEVTVRTLGGR